MRPEAGEDELEKDKVGCTVARNYGVTKVQAARNYNDDAEAPVHSVEAAVVSALAEVPAAASRAIKPRGALTAEQAAATREKEIRAMLRRSTFRCTCLALIHAERCRLFPRFAGERRWRGKDVGVTEDDLVFLERRERSKVVRTKHHHYSSRHRHTLTICIYIYIYIYIYATKGLT